MKLTYVSKANRKEAEARCVVDGLCSTEEGPEEIFIIRMSDPGVLRTIAAWMDQARIYGHGERLIAQAQQFTQKAAAYHHKNGAFAQQEMNVVKFETVKSGAMPLHLRNAVESAPAGAPPAAPGAPPPQEGQGQAPAVVPPSGEIGAPDGGTDTGEGGTDPAETPAETGTGAPAAPGGGRRPGEPNLRPTLPTTALTARDRRKNRKKENRKKVKRK